MSSFRHKIHAFNAGELSPKLYGRSDLEKYGSGCAELTNMLVLPTGGVTRRPGTQFAAEVKDSDDATRLIPFVYSASQSYILEFGDSYVRFFTSGGGVVDDGDGETPYEVATPYGASDLEDIKFVQSNDVLYLVHPDYAPRTLSRNAHEDWTLATLEIQDGPWLDENTDEDHELTVSYNDYAAGTTYDTGDYVAYDGAIYYGIQDDNTGNTPDSSPLYWTSTTDYEGNVVIDATAGKPTFQSTHVGALFLIKHINEDQIVEGSLSSATTTDTLRVEDEWKLITHGTWTGTLLLQRSTDDGTTWENYKTYSSKDDNNVEATGLEEEDALYRLKMSSYTSGTCTYNLSTSKYYTEGIVEIDEVVTTTQATGTVIARIGEVDTATAIWAEGAWSDYRGWPECVGFFEQRLLFAATTNQPQTIWGSKVGQYTTFKPGINDDDPINYSLAANQRNPIQWIVPKEIILIGTLGGEWRFGASDPRDPLTASDVVARQQSQIGGLFAQPVDDVVLFVDRQGVTLRELAYDYAKDAWVAPDMSILSDHLLESGIAEVAWHEHPYRILWCVTNDGYLLSFTYQRAHDVTAWAKHTTDGTFESVAVIPGSCGDEVWFVVNRTINGATKRFVEYIQPPGNVTDYALDTLAPWGDVTWRYSQCEISPAWRYDQAENSVQVEEESYQYDKATN